MELKSHPPLTIFKFYPESRAGDDFYNQIRDAMMGPTNQEAFHGHRPRTLKGKVLQWKGVAPAGILGIFKFDVLHDPDPQPETVDLSFLDDWTVLGRETVDHFQSLARLTPEELRILLS